MPELNWKHHTLIQSLLSRGPLIAEEFHKIFEGITGRNPGNFSCLILPLSICSSKFAECFSELLLSLNSLFAGVNEQLFNDYLLNINKELSFVQFELRACRNQYDGKVYYGVVNNVADEQAKLGTKYSVPQIAFYKGIVSSSC